MSSAVSTTYAHASSTVASTGPDQPPIVQFARAAGHVLAFSFSYLSHASTTLARYSFAPLSLLYAPIAYLLSPVIVLVQIVLYLFVFSPYNIAVSIARNVYPIYVFVGVACICAMFFGFVARMIAQGLTFVVFAPRSSATSSSDPLPATTSQEALPERKSSASSPTKTRFRKRVSIKDER